HPGTRGRGGDAVRDGRHARSPAARPTAPRREPSLHAAGATGAGPGHRTHRSRDSRPSGDRGRRGRVRLRRADRRAAPHRGGRVDPRRSGGRLDLLFRWTNEVIGKDDPEYRRPGETPGQTIRRARGELHAYFDRLIEQRRSDPEDDLVSELIEAMIDGAGLRNEQILSYF